MTREPDHIRAHAHSSGHHEEILSSEVCGCFYCLTTFHPNEVNEWISEGDGVRQTALCPRCGIDSVIGSKSGFPITPDFLASMHRYWFSCNQD